MSQPLKNGDKTQELSFRIQELIVTGDTAVAVVKVRSVIKSVRDGQFGLRGETHKMLSTTVVKDTWIKTPQGWRRKTHEKIVPNKLVIEGKLFDPRAREPR